MTDIIDAAKSTSLPTDTNPPVPPPPPIEPPPEPPPAPITDIPTPPTPSLSDNLVVPPPETKTEPEKPTENIQPEVQETKPKKNKLKPGVIITAILLLLVTIPLTVFYVSQNKQLLDIRSQAKKNDRYGLNTDKYRNNLERALLRDGIVVDGKHVDCSGGKGGTKCGDLPFIDPKGGKDLLSEAIKQETEKFANSGTSQASTPVPVPTSGIFYGQGTSAGITTYYGYSACGLMSEEAATACNKSPPTSLTIKEITNSDGTKTTYYSFDVGGDKALTSSQTRDASGKILSSTDNVGTTWDFTKLPNPNIGKTCTRDLMSDSCGDGGVCVGSTVGVQKGPGGVISGTCQIASFTNSDIGKPCTKDAVGGDTCGGGSTCVGSVVGVQKGPGGVIAGTCAPPTHGVTGTVPPEIPSVTTTFISGCGCASGDTECARNCGTTGHYVTIGGGTGGGTSDGIILPDVDMGGSGNGNDGGGGTTPPPQCISLIAYKNGNALTAAELAALHTGDVITLALSPGGAATKVRFRVNSTNDADWHESTTKNANSQFVWDYTLANATSFNVTAQWFDGSSWH